MIKLYILKDRVPVPATITEWGAFLNSPERVVDITELPGKVIISTVFLGIDPHRHEPPMLYETMIFGGPHSHYQDRSATWDDAVAIHRHACIIARLGLVEGGDA